MSTRAERTRAEASDELLVGPIRGDLLGADHLATRARDVARGQRIVAGRNVLRPARLLARLAETRRILADVHERLNAAQAQGEDAGPAAEWLLDNYYVVQEHLQEVRASLPGGYYRELPELAAGPLTGYPRVYEMAISLISHTEARVHPDNVDLYVASFQSVTPLTIGELWAMPAMLRLGLIESVRRMALRTVQRLDEIELGAYWADRIMSASARGGHDLRAALREFADAEHALTPDFVSRLLHSMRLFEGASAAMAWIKHWMRDAGVNPETAVTESTQRLVLTQIMMANSIMSLRDIGQRDWRVFVEEHSVMHAVLREDPSAFYARMTFATRDRYRHVVERIAKRTGHRETSVAQWAVDLARRHSRTTAPPSDPRRAHVGYFIVDDGLPELEQRAGYTPSFGERVNRAIHANPNVVFVGGLALCTTVALAIVTMAGLPELSPAIWLVLLFAFLPALDIAVTVVNQLVTALLPPRVLPRLDLHEHGVPAEFRTAVVVPTLLGSVDDVRQALENLEVQFLANREAHLHFAVLGDFTDAPQEVLPDDADIITAALEGVRALNARHAAGKDDEFHLFHRPRRWNAQQGVWMGWERKRGKLSDFNRLLRGATDDAFSVVSGDISRLQTVKYVITLDADTVLPPDAAPSLVGAMAHPLNRAVYDAEQRRIVHGYGILQPRVGVTLPSAQRTAFASIASGHPGVDPYTTAVSDVYQDLYGEGSYTGKGIYDVDAFQLATHGRFPENMLLSHDLIEGNYARAGLATDVIVYDDYPSTYAAYTRRRHRWIRGDWQLLPWLHRTVPGPDGPERNRLSWLSRWKIIDNLRRSTVELSQLLFLLAGWTLLPGSVLKWTLLGLGAIVAPWVTSLLLAVVRPPRDQSWRAYFTAVAQDAVVSAEQALLAIMFLPHQSWTATDAIVRTLYRLLVSRKRLLEWQPASLVERTLANRAGRRWSTMHLSGAIVAVATGTGTWYAWQQQAALGLPLSSLSTALVSAWMVALLWIAAPFIASRLSRATIPLRLRLSAEAREHATRYAVHHWRFFDHFVSADTQWLAPDNFQSDPAPVVAMRTSPTNIGLQLLATMSAHDLGLITVGDLTERLEHTFDTLATLPRFRGHFYNWYDLRDRRVLDPPYISTVDSGNIAGHLIAVRQGCLEIAGREASCQDRLRTLADRAYAYVTGMDFSFLYDTERKLFTIGYHPDSFTCDDSFYDLLASEARLASFVAIARNDVPVEHWFRLSRTLNRTGASTALVSWSGSMFEYLMPVLVMRSLPFTLLDQAAHSALKRHLAHGRRHHVPWGVSESAYNVRDHELTYQYHAFGVPDLALKRGLDRDLVIAPYASALAALIDPPKALANLGVLEAMGALGEYGFCDALDYTRPAPDQRVAFVRAFMAHHIGMTLVALTNVLRHDVWQRRFHADPLVQSVELLLHERVPRRLVLQKAQLTRIDGAHADADAGQPVVREVDTSTPALLASAPRIALLGSAPYTVMLNQNGSGYSRFESLAVTRWREDGTCDESGQYCYVKDVDANRVWSAAHQPVCAPADWSRAWLASDRVTLHRADGDIETRTEITVVPADCAEVRRVTVTNTGHAVRTIELTSYGEVVMARPDADRAHPAFSNLFVETEWHEWCSAITATRRPRTPDEPRLWCVHVVDAGRERVGPVTCETDRSRFIGRGRSVRDPLVMQTDGALSGSTGAVLDPIFALRARVRVLPGQSVSVAFTTLVARSRALAFELADRYHDAHAAQRAFDVAWTSTQFGLRELGISPANAAVFQEIAAQLLYRGTTLGPPLDEVRRNLGSQPRLWTYGISGDRPIVLATIDSVDGLPTLVELLAAHRYWDSRGLTVDLVVLNAQLHDYLQELRDGINDAIAATNDATPLDAPGGIFVRHREAFRTDDLLMLSATARVHITCDGRSLTRVLASAEARLLDASGSMGTPSEGHALVRSTPLAVAVVERAGALATFVSALRPLMAPRLAAAPAPANASPVSLRSQSLAFDNGIGGLNAAGDYEMIVDSDTLPPAPWANVIANPHGGFLVSERGSGCMWADSAQFYRLTPWHNDPVSDPTSDVLYLRDDDSGDLWSATPAPIDGDGGYRVQHGAGSTTFEHEHDGIETQLVVSVPEDAAVKLSMLRIRNSTDRPRALRLTAFVEWTLGTHRSQTQHQVRTRFLPDDCAIVAQNHFDEHYADWTAFLATSEPVASHSADRRSFIGANGCLARPAALTLASLDGLTGVGLDPCAALQMIVELKPGETRDVTVLLGAAGTEREARRLLERLRTSSDARAASAQSVKAWQTRLRVVTVRTPDAAFDAMLNRWSLYQALACRMWARTGLYQSSGAFGFRDQLQDVMAFTYAEPALARAHILRAASRQFVEGDVQHWWHPHTGRGVRTRFSDDLVWLPYVVDRYVDVTGDATVLEASVPYLDMLPLEPHEHERYDLPLVSAEVGTIYAHCVRALDRACTAGPLGLPLIGTGDWNDGMNRVGAEGRGESVWLAWFLVTTLRAFAVHSSRRGDDAVAATFRQRADAYVSAVETHAWDGQWYRRAYYDDGTPIGSLANEECRIDSIAQSWSVISRAGNPDRRRRAMHAFNQQLVRDDARVIMLLTPPFDREAHDPGYIKGYLPGVRENGAQYTHAALWAVQATAMQGDGDRAFALFQMLNPLTHTDTPARVARYRVEPFVVAADVYSSPALLGRGGWTWYTGSASWMYRVGLEQLLGFTKVGDTLRLAPCVPASWAGFDITYQFGTSTWQITVEQPSRLSGDGGVMTVDGQRMDDRTIHLVDDGQVHVVRLTAT